MALDPAKPPGIHEHMQKGLFSHLPSISNWPSRVDLAMASCWAQRIGLDERGDFQAVLSAETGPLLWADRAAVDAKAIGEGEEAAPPLLTALARTLAQPGCYILARPKHARTLAALAESQLPPICPESAPFHTRHAVDPDFGGRSPADEGTRLATLFAPSTSALVLANHGVLTRGISVAEALHRLHLFERAAETYLAALATGRALRIMPEEIIATLPTPDAAGFFADLKRQSGNLGD